MDIELNFDDGNTRGLSQSPRLLSQDIVFDIENDLENTFDNIEQEEGSSIYLLLFPYVCTHNNLEFPELSQRQDHPYGEEPQIEQQNELSDEEGRPGDEDEIVSHGSSDLDPNILPDANIPHLFDPSFVPVVDEIRISVEFIRAIRAATLDNGDLDPTTLARLRNPPDEQLKIEDENEMFSLKQFIATSRGSEDTYRNIRINHNERYSDNAMLSLEQVQTKVQNWSGVIPIKKDQCFNTCIAYTGPFENLGNCPECGKKKVPERQFYTFPLGPQIQARFRNPESAEEMMYLRNEIAKVQSKLDAGEDIHTYDDVTTGSELLNALNSGIIKDTDILFMQSLDGVQLYEDKKSDSWIIIYILLLACPSLRYKKCLVLPGGIVGGPNNPKNMDSFLFPGLCLISALQKETLRIWDSLNKTYFQSMLIYWLTSADGPGSVYMTGLVGHQGAYPCRIFCGLKGRHQPGKSHHYLTLLKPDNYNVSGCDHGDVNTEDIRSGSSQDYAEKCGYLLHSIPSDYKVRRRQTGITRPSILLGLQPEGLLSLTSTFGGDTMHCLTLNMGELFMSLWRGQMRCASTDTLNDWDWAVLQGDVFKEHGAAVASCRPYIPGSYDHPPRNLAEKVNTKYKAKEWQTYLYGLAPALLLGILPEMYWKNLCKLVRGVRIILQRSIARDQVIEAQQYLEEFHLEFEAIYIQRRPDRIYFLWPCVHAVLHLGLEVPRLCPPGLYSAWTMECTVGNLGEEIRSHSRPYANLTQRALLRGQINALESMLPELRRGVPDLPQGAVNLGNDYALLRARERYPHMPHRAFHTCILQYLETHYGYSLTRHGAPRFQRWARLLLPNGQIARCSWKELQMPAHEVRRARCVKMLIDGKVEFGEVHYYFTISITDRLEAFTLVQLYSAPNQQLLEDSSDVLYSVVQLPEETGLRLIKVEDIQGVVAVIPHSPREVIGPQTRWFIWERMGLDISMMQSVRVDTRQRDNLDNNSDE
ncbi:hypothetical protein M422DRAFT_62428 [Sphaerobolus stellatus SS14]|uniref:Transposase domain-containing protein n=1 Tax=Sphaerobolus stellatus (strain SS14) TaxID=990650 RepID=A0A0C9TNC2_SPHS4|nr:hypothetical protein M422DRAFT_62428 [Sphaerobolus stellatus SS14]